jgi:hypothetical protein
VEQAVLRSCAPSSRLSGKSSLPRQKKRGELPPSQEAIRQGVKHVKCLEATVYDTKNFGKCTLCNFSPLNTKKNSSCVTFRWREIVLVQV